MRTCNKCGIVIPLNNSTMNAPKSWGVGKLCKICTKYANRERALKYYYTSDIKARRCKEPEQKNCVICNKSFYTAYKIKITCSKECANIRKKETDKRHR